MLTLVSSWRTPWRHPPWYGGGILPSLHAFILHGAGLMRLTLASSWRTPCRDPPQHIGGILASSMSRSLRHLVDDVDIRRRLGELHATILHGVGLMTKLRASSGRAPRLRPLWRQLDEVDGDRPPSRLDASSLLCASMGECAAMCESATSAVALSAASGCVRPTHIEQEQDYFTAVNPPVGAFIYSPLLFFHVRVSSPCSLGARATAWARSPISSMLLPGAHLLVFSGHAGAYGRCCCLAGCLFLVCCVPSVSLASCVLV